MQPRAILLILFLLCLFEACASHVKKRDYSELDIATATGCTKPSMVFDALRDGSARPVSPANFPIRVKPGVYTIGIECSWAHDAVGECVDTQGIQGLQVPPYDLILNPKVRYLFSCDMEGKEYVIRMSENLQK